MLHGPEHSGVDEVVPSPQRAVIPVGRCLAQYGLPLVCWGDVSC